MDWEPTTRQIRALERQLRQVRDQHEYRRLLAVLEVGRGTPIAEVSRRLGIARQSVYNWIELYTTGGGPEELRTSLQVGRPSIWTETLEAVLRKTLDRSPGRWGYQAGQWTVGLLQHHLEIHTRRKPSESSLRRQLHEMGYVWKRSRYVLEPDPEREKKTADPPKTRGFARAEPGFV